MYCPSVLQPGKLTEAFKYFLQGMGYSKYSSPRPTLETGGQAAKWGWHTVSGDTQQPVGI